MFSSSGSAGFWCCVFVLLRLASKHKRCTALVHSHQRLKTCNQLRILRRRNSHHVRPHRPKRISTGFQGSATKKPFRTLAPDTLCISFLIFSALLYCC